MIIFQFDLIMELSVRRAGAVMIPWNFRLRESGALKLEILFKHVYSFSCYTPVRVYSSYFFIFILAESHLIVFV